MSNENPTFDKVMDLARRWLHAEVRDLAKQFRQELERGDYGRGEEAREKFDEALTQLCDGHEFVIYTAKAWMVCAASDNDDAYENVFGDQPEMIEQRAMYALREDVIDQLRAEGIDINDPAPEPEDNGIDDDDAHAHEPTDSEVE